MACWIIKMNRYLKTFYVILAIMNIIENCFLYTELHVRQGQKQQEMLCY